jgi:hypothetical protein
MRLIVHLRELSEEELRVWRRQRGALVKEGASYLEEAFIEAVCTS